MTSKEVPQEILEFNENRVSTYSFLARMYEKELTKDIIKEMRQKGGFVDRIRPLVEEGDAMGEGAKILIEYLESLRGRDLEQVELELASEYAGLFLGVWGSPPQPSESVYRSPDRLVMQEPRDEVLREYRGHLVDKIEEFKEPEDHIALELYFMAHLGGKATKAMEKGDLEEARELAEDQKRFLEEHLLKWMRPFTDDIQKGGRRPFYKGIGLITQGFVTQDKDAVESILEELGS
jgi:TorA maturation chaperone TorD